jgi:hypothetical protein
MRFDGAFAVPGWVADFAKDRQALMLVRWAMGEEGARAEPNAGAHALAAWIVADPERARRAANLPGGLLFLGDRVVRWLAGTVLPGVAEQVEIEEATAGAVRWDSWFQQSPVQEAAIAPPDSAAERIEDVAPAAPPVLGEMPSGPLFRAEREGRTIVVHGLGVTLRTSEAAAKRLRDTLTHALAPPGDRAPSLAQAGC